MKQRVSDCGQITLPKQLREELDINGGDAVEIRNESGTIVIEKLTTQADVAAGYRTRGDYLQELHDTIDGISNEADAYLGDIPDWE